MNNKIVRTIRLEKSIVQKIESLAAREKRTISGQINALLEFALNALENNQ